MDVVKLFDMLFDDEELRGIPAEHIYLVAYEMLEIIGSGVCFFDNEERSIYEPFVNVRREQYDDAGARCDDAGRKSKGLPEKPCKHEPTVAGPQP